MKSITITDAETIILHKVNDANYFLEHIDGRLERVVLATADQTDALLVRIEQGNREPSQEMVGLMLKKAYQ